MLCYSNLVLRFDRNKKIFILYIIIIIFIKTLPPLSAYSDKFWLGLTLHTNGKSISIWDLTTNPIWDKNRGKEVIGINGTIANSSELFFEVYPKILASAKKLDLILTGWSDIELKRLSFSQRTKDIMKISALLALVRKYPEEHPLVLTDDVLILLWISRGLEFDSNGYRQWFGKYTLEHLKKNF